jgi:putative tributyrin esterase
MNTSRAWQLVFLALMILLPARMHAAQTKMAALIGSGQIVTAELESKLMGRKMPYRVVLPPVYNAKAGAGRRFPILYLLHGLTGHFDNWTDRSDLGGQSAEYGVIIVTPEGENGWYTDNNSKDGQKYESYLIQELIPEIEKRYRTQARRDQRAVAGLSMGGFGAVKFGLKYPEMFAVVGSFSGALGIATMTEKQFPGAIGRTIDQIFGPPETAIRKANDPFEIVRSATPDKIKSWPFFYFDCGTEDILFKSNRDFADLLWEKSIPHEFRQLPGSHNWKYWDAQVKEFLRLSSRTFGMPAALK